MAEIKNYQYTTILILHPPAPLVGRRILNVVEPGKEEEVGERVVLLLFLFITLLLRAIK